MSAMIEIEPTREQDLATIAEYNRTAKELSPKNWDPVREGVREGMRRVHPDLFHSYGEAMERERARREAAEVQAQVQTAAPIAKPKSTDKPQAGIDDFTHHSFRVTFERAFSDVPVVVVTSSEGIARLSHVDDQSFSVAVSGANRGTLSWMAMPATQSGGIENL